MRGRVRGIGHDASAWERAARRSMPRASSPTGSTPVSCATSGFATSRVTYAEAVRLGIPMLWRSAEKT